MNRRAFLATAGAVCVAGCVGGATSSTGDSPTETNERSPTDTGTPTPLDPTAVLSVETLGTASIDASDADGDGGGTLTAVDVRVENVWDRTIGKVTVAATWLDAGGTASATTREWLYALAPGEVWRAAVLSDPDGPADGVDVSVDPQRQTIAPGPLSAPDHRMAVDDGAAFVTGTVANAGEDDVFPTVFGKFLDEAGTIVGGATAPVTTVPADGAVEFELAYRHRRVGRSPPADYELVLDVPDTAGADCLC
jgi:hypothetical protein